MFKGFTNRKLSGIRMHISTTKSTIWSPLTRENDPKPHTTNDFTSSSGARNFSTPMMALAR